MNKLTPDFFDGIRYERKKFKNFNNFYDDKPRCKKKLDIKKPKKQIR